MSIKIKIVPETFCLHACFQLLWSRVILIFSSGSYIQNNINNINLWKNLPLRVFFNNPLKNLIFSPILSCLISGLLLSRIRVWWKWRCTCCYWSAACALRGLLHTACFSIQKIIFKIHIKKWYQQLPSLTGVWVFHSLWLPVSAGALQD